MKKRYIKIAGVCLPIVIITAICILIINNKNISKLQFTSAKTSSQIEVNNSSLSQLQIDEYISKATAGQSIELPDGKPWDGDAWNGLNVKFLVLGLGSDAPVTSIIGNHAEILSQEKVTVDTEPGLLVLVDRTQSADEEIKAGENKHSYEYWLIKSNLKPYPGRNDMQLAYVLFATFTTSQSEARSNLLELAKGWKTPDNCDGSSQQITKSSAYNVNKVSQP